MHEIERTAGQTRYRIIQTIATKELGFNRLLGQLGMANHRLRRELRNLEDEGYLRKRTRGKVEQSEKPHRGRPEEPYTLTEKATKFLAGVKELKEFESNKRNRLQQWLRGEITQEECFELPRSIYDQLGLQPPTVDEKRKKALEISAEYIEALPPNRIVLIETFDGPPFVRLCFRRKPEYIIREEPKHGILVARATL